MKAFKFVPALAAAGALALSFVSSAAISAPLKAAAVASPDYYGALAAKEILKAGGNAADAAVATAFALAVTYPEAGNIGGGGFTTLLINGKAYFLDYRETAPGAARADMYQDAKGNVIPGLSEVGVLASGVPGTVRGMAELHKRFGKLSWRQDLAPAIRFARQGFKVNRQFYDLKDESEAPFLKSTNFQHYFGKVKAGKVFRQTELASTLERIARLGPDEFYTGKTADLLVAQMSRHGGKGLITKKDLAAYKPVWREPLTGAWGDYTVITAPPPSSGGIALIQMLNMKRDRADLFGKVTLNSAQYVHLISEIEKRVFADRAEYMGDPDFVKVPVQALTDPAYIEKRAREIDPEKPSVLAAVKAGLEKPQTTHFSIVDKDGNAVSNTYTLNGWFGAGVVVEGAGFLLNDEMDDFSSKPGAPNMYGVVGADANAIAPFKRPLSSMTPTIITKGGDVAMVVGTPGGSRIFTSVFQVVADVYDFGLPLKDAQHAFRFHHQLLPENVVFSEPFLPIPKELRTELSARGYKIEDQGWNGDIEAIKSEDGRPIPEADPRARGVALIIR
jgi:gamma-glutamyltranspeptidase/glutathione hydrolase